MSLFPAGFLFSSLSNRGGSVAVLFFTLCSLSLHMWSRAGRLVGHFAFDFKTMELSAEGGILRGGLSLTFCFLCPEKSVGRTPLFLEIITVFLPVAVSFFSILLFFVLCLLAFLSAY